MQPEPRHQPSNRHRNRETRHQRQPNHNPDPCSHPGIHPRQRTPPLIQRQRNHRSADRPKPGSMATTPAPAPTPGSTPQRFPPPAPHTESLSSTPPAAVWAEERTRRIRPPNRLSAAHNPEDKSAAHRNADRTATPRHWQEARRRNDDNTSCISYEAIPPRRVRQARSQRSHNSLSLRMLVVLVAKRKMSRQVQRHQTRTSSRYPPDRSQQYAGAASSRPSTPSCPTSSSFTYM